jgi:hypothetical protein
MKKVCLSLLIIIMFSVLITGCDGFNPLISNEDYDEDNTELAYLKIFPSQTTMNVNQSKTFEVKAYNSDNKLIAMDVSQIKWSARYTSCYFCVEWTLSPTQGSVKTVFTPINPEKKGKYKVFVNYGGQSGKWAEANVEVN